MTPNLAKALWKFQCAPPHITADSTNPHFRNRFASLGGVMSAVRPALNACGLVVAQFPSNLGGAPALRTIVLHPESGEQVEDVMPLMLSKDDPQAQGSALTYARRYALLSVLGLVADEDDDGDATRSGRGTDGAHMAGRPAGGTAAGSEPASPSTFVPPESVTNRVAPTDGGSPEAVVIDFGKHKGRQLHEVDRGYLTWLVEKFEPKSPSARRIQAAAADLLGRGTPAPVVDDSDGIPF